MASDDLARTMAIEMARYNRWQNETLYDHCATLGEAALARDEGLFFGSILATLDHILHVDRVLVRYLHEGRPPADFDPHQRVHEDFAALRAARETFDTDLEALIRDAPAGWLAEEFRFHSERLVCIFCKQAG